MARDSGLPIYLLVDPSRQAGLEENCPLCPSFSLPIRFSSSLQKRTAQCNQSCSNHFGLAYPKLDDRPRAKSEFQNATATDPESPLAERARRFSCEPADTQPTIAWKVR